MKRRVLIALTIFFVPVQVHSATYFVQALTCNGSTAHQDNQPDPVGFDDVFWDCMDAESWTALAARAGRGVLRARAYAEDGHAGFDHPNGAMGEATASMTYTDVIVEGPGPTTEVSLLLDVHADLSPAAIDGASQAGIKLNVSIHTNYLSGNAFMEVGSDPMDPAAWGLLEGMLVLVAGGAEVHGIVRTPPVTVPANTTLIIAITLDAYAAAYDPHRTASSLSDASNTLSFPSSGPVFELPAGYTVHSVDAGILDNQWSPDVSNDETSWGMLKSRY